MSELLLSVEGPITAASALASLTLLHAPEVWIQRVQQKFLLRDDSVTSHVEMDLILPDTDFLASKSISVEDTGTLWVPVTVMSPKRRELINLDGLCVDGERAHHLSHHEHIALTQTMMVTRFLTIFNSLVGLDDSELDALLQDLDVLVTIPEKRRPKAVQIVRGRFNGKLLGSLPDSLRTEDSKQDERRLFALCNHLAEAYPVLVPVAGEPGTRHTISYSITEPLERELVRRRDRIRHYLESQPTAFRIHAPLAKLCNSYTATFNAPDGYFIYEQRVLCREHHKRPRHRPIAGWGCHDRDEYSNLKETQQTWSARTGGGTSCSRLFIAGAPRLKRKSVYLGVRFFEAPPGSSSRPMLLGIAAALVLGVLVVWMHFGLATVRSDVPAVAVALAAIVPTAAGLIAEPRRLTGAPILPRLVLLTQTCILLGFTFWLLLRSAAPLMGTSKWISDLSTLPRLTYGFGGIVLLTGMCLTTLVARARVSRAFQSQKDALEPDPVQMENSDAE